MSQTKRTSFTGSLGGKLDARLELPDDPPMAYALFAHCFTCSKDYIAAARISRALADRGIAVLRFDFTGLGQSEGDFANTNFSSNVADVICAANHLREHYEAPKMLIGHSLGGAAVLAAAHRVAESLAMATIAAPNEPAHITRHFAEQLPAIESRGETEVRSRAGHFACKSSFLKMSAAMRCRRSSPISAAPCLSFTAKATISSSFSMVSVCSSARHKPRV